jgi:transcriptional regulator with XRE-family HTH domain
VIRRRERIAEIFARNLLRERHRAGMTQAELGRRTGLHRTEVSYLEHAKRIPRLETLVKLCDSLEVDPGQLLDGINWLWDQQRFASASRPEVDD